MLNVSQTENGCITLPQSFICL